MLDYLIIGAGVTGITLSKFLRKAGIDSVLVLEKEDRPGGLCKTEFINGHTLDIGGGHFFHTKHQEIFDYIFSFLPKERFNYYERVSKIKLGDVTIDYTIESTIWQMPMEDQIEYLISVVRNGEALGMGEPSNYEEWIRWKLGNRICDEYMIPYNEKLWGVSPSEMDIDWLYKIPRVNVDEVLRYCLERKQDVTKFPAHIHFYYPKKGGFESIVNAIAKDEMQYIRLNEKVSRMVYMDDHWVINDTYEAKNVINTSPWNDLFEALGKPREIEEDIKKIRYNRIVVSLYEHGYEHNWHWRYVPDGKLAHHREFYIGNFAEDSRDDGIYLETGIRRFDEKTASFEGVKPIESFTTDAAYPIPVVGHTEAINNILKYYEPMHLYGVGRWGQHEYQNADVSMHEAVRFVKSLS